MSGNQVSRGTESHAHRRLTCVEQSGVHVPRASLLPRLRRARTFAITVFLIAFMGLFAFAPIAPIALAVQTDENLVDPTQRADNSFIYDTTIESLTDQISLYDGKTVQIVGEVIGDKIAASEDGYCWITLTVIDTEDKTSISVLLSDEQATQIDRYGKYGVTGTILQVRGTYNSGCIEHEGLADIHATYSAVMTKGEDHFDELNLSQFGPGAIAVIIGAALMAAFHFARERMR